ncbi:hypothetical protein F4818DRAFT_435556 [Hypoxylon cercidicola]|nr:hypothetical protein F4818DRAFT_435556 [Hypoxylon cercidicola]
MRHASLALPTRSSRADGRLDTFATIFAVSRRLALLRHPNYNVSLSTHGDLHRGFAQNQAALTNSILKFFDVLKDWDDAGARLELDKAEIIAPSGLWYYTGDPAAVEPGVGSDDGHEGEEEDKEKSSTAWLLLLGMLRSRRAFILVNFKL